MKKRRYNYYRSGRHEATSKERLCFPVAGSSKRGQQLHLSRRPPRHHDRVIVSDAAYKEGVQ